MEVNAILPAPAAFRVNVPVAVIPVVVTVSMFAVVFSSIPPLAVTVNPRVNEAAAPVYDRAPPFRFTALVAFPRLLAPPETTIVSTDSVPP